MKIKHENWWQWWFGLSCPYCLSLGGALGRERKTRTVPHHAAVQGQGWGWCCTCHCVWLQYYLVDNLMKFIILILSFKIPCFLKRKIHNICFKIKNKKIPYLGGAIWKFIIFVFNQKYFAIWCWWFSDKQIVMVDTCLVWNQQCWGY